MSRDEFIRQIKACGQSVIDNAEKIYNSFQYSTEGVHIEIEVDTHCIPTITVVNKFFPEGFIENIGVKKEAEQ